MTLRYVVVPTSALILFCLGLTPAQSTILDFHGPDDCIENGGKYLCTDPIKTPWEYRMCRPGGAYAWEWPLECENWNEGAYQHPECVGSKRVYDETTISSKLENYQKDWTGNCDVSADGYSWPTHTIAEQGDPGYEYDGCWQVGSDYPDEDHVTVSITRVSMSGQMYDQNQQCTQQIDPNSYFAIRRDRVIGCPAGYSDYLLEDGSRLCYKKVDDSCPVGNPVHPVSFTKIQTEKHYSGTVLGQLSFSQTFNSSAEYKPYSDGTPITTNPYGIYWKTNYDKRIYPIGNNTYVSAFADRANGQFIFFDQSGEQIHDLNGVREKLITTGSGWEYHASQGNVETYDSEGKLTSITTRNGLTETLIYSDTNTPSQIAPETGLLIEVHDEFNRSLLMTYNFDSRLQTLTDPEGNEYSFSYNEWGLLNKVIYPTVGTESAFREYVYESTNGREIFLLTGIIDENGDRYATYTYNSNAQIFSSEHAGGADRKEFHHNSRYYKRVHTLIGYDENGAAQYRQDMIGHDDINGVSKVVSAGINNCSFCQYNNKLTTYDSQSGYIASSEAHEGDLSYFEHDSEGHLTCRLEGLNLTSSKSAPRAIKTDWNLNLNVPTTVSVYEPRNSDDPNQSSCSAAVFDWTLIKTTNNDYYQSGDYRDGLPRIRTEIDNLSSVQRVTTFDYDQNSKQITFIDGPRTDVNDYTTFDYAASTGNLTKVTDALGYETTFSNHDANGRPQTITDPNGLITTLTYHPRGWLTSRTVDGHTTTFDYDNVGQLTKLTLPTGAFISYTYDAAHRLTDITDNLGNTIHYTLDPMGNRTREETKDNSGSLKRLLEREYNQLNKLQLLIGGNTQITRYAYDYNGNQTASTDPRNTGTDRTVAAALDPLQTDNTSQSLYDALNRLVEVVNLQDTSTTTDDVVTTYEYNALDQLTKVIDPNNLETIYTYNALGDLEQLNSPDTGITAYTYDDAGNRLTQTDARGVTTTYTYDALNRLTTVSYPDTSLNVTYTYDENGNNQNGIGRLTTMTDASGETNYFYDKRGNITDKVVTIDNLVSTFSFAYNGTDQLTQITYPSGRQIDYDYDAAGRIDQVSMTEDGTTTILAENLEYAPFGPVTALDFGNGLPMTRQYDLDYRLSSNVQGTVLDMAYQYDGASNIDQITDNLNVSNNQTFGYDGLSRLTSALGGYGSQGYDYDKTGNRTQKTDNSTTDNYNYPSNSHHLSDINNAEIFSYDQNGNTTDLPNPDIFTSLTYGDQNRLTSVNVASYTYNGTGERVRKAGAETTYYDYGLNGELLAERDSAGEITKEYVFVNGELLAALSGTGTTNPPNPPTVDDIVIDNGDSNTTSTGSWSVSGNPGFHDDDSLYATNTATYRWTPNVITAGNYQVYAWWTEHSNRTTAAPYTIHYNGGSQTVSMNQTPSGPGGGQWVLLDTYNFAAGSTGYIELTVSYDSGHSFSADAIKLVYADGGSSNNNPTVSLTAPTEGATYTEGDTITITANASDSEGSIASVEFYAGATLLGTDTSAPYSYSWTSATVGSHSLTAIAYDDQNASTTSSAVNITVNSSGGSVTDIVIDNGDINTSSTGSWSVSGNPGFHDTDSLYASNTATYRWTPNIITAGSYQVYAWWTAHANRTSTAPYTTVYSGGSDTVMVDQSTAGAGGGQWVLLGTYTFATGTTGYIELTASYDSGHSFSADAIKLVYAGGGSSNNNPTVNLTAPTDGATYTEGDTITITAIASDSDGSISNVEFSADSTLLGTDTSAPYSYSWTSATVGSHSLTAIAYDDQSASTPSSAVNITVNPAGGSVADIIIDNGDSNTSSTGSWSVSGNPGFHDTDSLYASNTATYRWTPNIITAGNYQVYAWWTEHSNRTTSAPYTTHYNGGSQTVTVNQTPSGQGGGQWVLLDTYNFAAGSSGYIELTASYDNNHSFSADAIKLVYVGGQ